MVKTSEKPKFNRDIHYSAKEMEKYIHELYYKVNEQALKDILGESLYKELYKE